LNDQQWRRARGFIAWGVFGLIILVAASIIASLLFVEPRASGNYYAFFPALFFPFHFGWLGGIFIVLMFFLIAKWIFLPWRNGSASNSHLRSNADEYARNILKERYAKGEITKEQFEQMMLDLKKSE
jgi:putative membrane protein